MTEMTNERNGSHIKDIYILLGKLIRYRKTQIYNGNLIGICLN